jgi:FkbM family methyltransferase
MNLARRIAGKIKRSLLPEKLPAINVLDLNSRYDLETIEIIKGIGSHANCIDIGAHKGDILRQILKYSPGGKHFAFEPLPHLYEELQKNFGKRCSVYPYALADVNGDTNFNYVISNPAYSGIRKRKYDRPHEDDTILTVQQRKLDDIIPGNVSVQLIKIDVEGGEFSVLKGAEKILANSRPIIIYEQGIGGSDVYGTDPGLFFDFMTSFGYKISLMEYYLMKKNPFTKSDYCTQFNNGYNFYFIAYTE